MDFEMETLPEPKDDYKSKLEQTLESDALSESTRQDIKLLLVAEQIGTDDFCRCAQDLLAQADSQIKRQEAVDATIYSWEQRLADRKPDDNTLIVSGDDTAPFDKIQQKDCDVKMTVKVKQLRRRKKLGLPPNGNDNQPQD